MTFRQLPPDEATKGIAEQERRIRRGKEHLRDLTIAEGSALIEGLARRDSSKRATVSGVRFSEGTKVRLANLAHVDFVDADLRGLWVYPPRFGKEVLVEGCTFDECVWEAPFFERWRVVNSTFRKTRFEGTFLGWFTKATLERTSFEDCVLPHAIKECVLRDVEFRARGAMETYFDDCRLERVTARARFMIGVHACHCMPLDLREAQVTGCSFNEIQGEVLLPRALGNCVVRGTTLAEMRAEVLPQLSLDGRAEWDRRFNPEWKESEYISVGGAELKGFTKSDAEAIERVLFQRSIAVIRAD